MSEHDDLSAILTELAAGRITPDEAAVRIDGLKNAGPTATEPQDPTQAPAGEDSPQPTGEPAPDQGPGEQPPQDSSGKPWPDFDQLSSQFETLAGPFAKAARQTIRGFANQARDAAQGATGAPFRTEGPQSTGGVDRVRIRSVGHRVRVVGDPSVATVSVSGPHVLRRTGALVEVTSDGDIGPTLEGFSVINPPRSFDDLRTLGFGKELFVRVNPALPVDVEVTAGSLTTSKVARLGDVRVTAGGANISDVVQIENCLVQAGSATIHGAISEGRSQVKVESGSLTIGLAVTSNVTVTGEASLGRISWPGEASGNFDQYVIGNGSAKLEVNVVMGYATIRSGEDT